uniref:PRAME family member 8-like n=2 Tax=Jaculus jaculus TaxID=51337 RepID=A0A8C5KED9_JACJA
MNVQVLPTLVQLAKESLLKKENLSISDLEDLPGELFPSLFKEAFDSRKLTILRAMVAVW